MNRRDEMDPSERILHDFVCPGMRAARLFNLERLLLRTRAELGVAQTAISKHRDCASKKIEKLEKGLGKSREDVQKLTQDLESVKERLDRFIRSQTVPFPDPLSAPGHPGLLSAVDESIAESPNDQTHGYDDKLLRNNASGYAGTE